MSTRRRRSHRAIVIFIALCVALGISILAPTSSLAAPVPNSQAGLVGPGEQLKFTHDYKMTTKRSSRAGTETSSTEGTYSYGVERTNSGYAVAVTQSKVKLIMDGQIIDSPFYTALLNVPMNIVLDGSAQAIDVQGIDNAMTVFQQRVGEEVYAQYAPFLSPDELTKQVKAEWNVMVWKYMDIDPKVGYTRVIPYQVSMPDDTVVPAQVTIKVTGVQTQGTRRFLSFTRKAEIATPALLAAYRGYYSRVDMGVVSASVSVDDKLQVDMGSGLLISSTEKVTTKLRISSDEAPPVDSKEEQYVERRTKIE